jgi:hypothetical protein
MTFRNRGFHQQRPSLFIIALTATVLAFIQNMVMFSFGLKELAILSFPLSFTGIGLAQVISIWAGYFCVRKFLHARRSLALAGWVIIVLGACTSGELFLNVDSAGAEKESVEPD